jgi:hypothetical protein
MPVVNFGHLADAQRIGGISDKAVKQIGGGWSSVNKAICRQCQSKILEVAGRAFYTIAERNRTPASHAVIRARIVYVQPHTKSQGFCTKAAKNLQTGLLDLSSNTRISARFSVFHGRLAGRETVRSWFRTC